MKLNLNRDEIWNRKVAWGKLPKYSDAFPESEKVCIKWIPVIEDRSMMCSVCEKEKTSLRFSDSAGIVCEKCFVMAKRCACGNGEPVIKASGGIKCRECWVTDGDWKGVVEALRAEDMITRRSVAWLDL